jgi:hypothetical protein
MSLSRRYWFLAIAVLLLLPSAAFATTSFAINTTCITGVGLGTCPPPFPDPSAGLTYGASVSGSASYTYTFGDGDSYLVSWQYAASYGANGSYILAEPTATYIETSPSVGTDTLTFNMYETIYDNTPGSWDGVYTEYVPLFLSSNVGTGSTISGELYIDSTSGGLGLVGPYGPGTWYGQNSVDLTSLGSGSTLVEDYRVTFVFAPGTQIGASGASVPEPALALPVGLALLGLGIHSLLARRRAGYNTVVAGGRL